MRGLRLVEQRVVDPGEPRGHRALEHDHRLRTGRPRGSASRRSASPGSFLAAGLVTSLAPITSVTSVRGNSGLISSISLSRSYGHVGLGEQHVHVAGHPPGDRVDRELDLDALGLERPLELADRVLGLRDRHPVAGRDHHLARVGELDRDVLGVVERTGAAGRRPRRRPAPRPRRRTRRRRSPAPSGSSPWPSGWSGSCPRRRRSSRRRSSPCCSSAMPVAAADSPVNAFSSEITTGMSAPPIGSTTMFPSSAAATRIPRMNSACECVPAASTIALATRDHEQRDVDRAPDRGA